MAKPEAPAPEEIEVKTHFDVKTDFDLLDESEPFDPDGKPVDPKVEAWVERAYSHWLEFPDKWRTTPPLSSLDAAKAIVDEARRYGTKVRIPTVTLQVRDYVTDDDGTARIIYRVRDKVLSGRKPSK